MVNLESIVRQLVSLLRYFAAPFVGAITVWIFDEKHDVFNAVLVWREIGEEPVFSLWPLMVFLAVLGIVVYFAHRTIFHPLVTKIMVWLAVRRSTEQPSVHDLAFERWRRRGAQHHTPEHSSQVVLDEANAAGHFFYCSCWAAISLAILFNAVFPMESGFGRGIWGFLITVFILFVLGLVNDWQTTKWDLEAYRRYHRCQDSAT